MQKYFGDRAVHSLSVVLLVLYVDRSGRKTGNKSHHIATTLGFGVVKASQLLRVFNAGESVGV